MQGCQQCRCGQDSVRLAYADSPPRWPTGFSVDYLDATSNQWTHFSTNAWPAPPAGCPDRPSSAHNACRGPNDPVRRHNTAAAWVAPFTLACKRADDIVARQGFATFGDYPIMAESHISAACKATPRSGPTTIHLEEYTAGVGRFAQMCIDGDGGDPYDVSSTVATAAPAICQRGR